MSHQRATLPSNFRMATYDDINFPLAQNIDDLNSSLLGNSNSSHLAHPIMHSSRTSGESRSSRDEHVAGRVDDRHHRRPLPVPRPFEGRGDRDIKQFFRVYEQYAMSMWGNNF